VERTIIYSIHQPDSTKQREYTKSLRWKSQKTSHSTSDSIKLFLQNPLIKQLLITVRMEEFHIVDVHLAYKEKDIIYVWNLKSGECDLLFEGHSSEITSLVIINSDTEEPRVLSSSHTETLLWDLMTGKIIKCFKLITSSVILDPRRNNCVALLFPKSPMVEIWDFGRHRVVPSIVSLREGDAPAISLGFFKKRQKMVSCHTDRTIHIWNLLSNECDLTLKEDQDIVTVFPIRDHIISITIDGYCHIWPILTEKLAKKVLSQRISSPVANGVRFIDIILSDPDGYSLNASELKLSGEHFPDVYKLTSLDTFFRVTEREQIIIGQLNNSTCCFVLSKEII